MNKLLLALAVLLFFPALGLAQQRNAFIDPTTGALKAVGYVQTNAPGEIKIAVPADFALKPGEARWNGSSWVAVSPNTEPAALDLQDLAFSIDNAVSSPLVPQEIKDVLIKLKKVLGR